MKINWFFYALFIGNINGLLHAEFECLKFHKTKETLLKIQEIISSKQKGAYLRFGDGDLELAHGQRDLLQYADHTLQREMQEALALNGPTVLKTLPLYCPELGGHEPGMFPGNHEAPYEWCVNILRKAKPLWDNEFRDVYSHVALHFAASQMPDVCIDFLKFLKKSNCTVFIGNKNVPKAIRDMLFGPDCVFIPTPPTNSYAEIDRIENETLKVAGLSDKYQIIVTAMGCSGRPLQKRLWNKLNNIFLFDFGSLMDALCGWNTRAWIELTKFDEKKLIEALTEGSQSTINKEIL